MSKEQPKKTKVDIWWEETYKERENLLRKTFGTTTPPGFVTSFSWDHPNIIIPGGCALTFPPTDQRKHWLYISHGLAQPLNPDLETHSEKISGYGWEFAILTSKKAGWAKNVLYEILTYLMETKNVIEPGNRVPIVFYDQNGTIEPIIRDLQADDPYEPFGEMRALLFWPYLLHPNKLKTRTGSFGILVGTSITSKEWEMARLTSSVHVLLLLLKAGINQVSNLYRISVTENNQWSEEWDRIRLLPQAEVESLLKNNIVSDSAII